MLWVCPRCGSANGGALTACASCGLLRGAEASPGRVPDQPGFTPTSAMTREPPLPSTAAAQSGSLAWPLVRRFGWLALVAAVAIGGYFFAARRDDSGQITDAGSLASTELRAGDCFDLPDTEAELVEDVDARPCAESHQFEVFLVGEVPEGEFPGDEAFDDYAFDNCFPAFADFVGLPFEESRLDMYYLVPTAESWEMGDREVTCAAYHPLDDELTGSLRNSRR